MRYLRSYQFVFDNPQWAMNVLWASLCLLSSILIPVIGQLVLIGYLYEIAEYMHRRGGDDTYPDFTFDRFTKYLTRGVWVFVVQLLVALPVSLLLGAFCAVLIAVMVSNRGELGTAGVVLVVAFVVLMFVLGIVLGIVLVPMTLRAGLGQEFKGAFSVAFIRDFLRRTWRQVVVAQLFLMVTSFPLSLAGMALCCIGVFPAAALIAFAQVHLHYQLYELYLQRGGEEIPLKEEEPTAPAGA